MNWVQFTSTLLLRNGLAAPSGTTCHNLLRCTFHAAPIHPGHLFTILRSLSKSSYKKAQPPASLMGSWRHQYEPGGGWHDSPSSAKGPSNGLQNCQMLDEIPGHPASGLTVRAQRARLRQECCSPRLQFVCIHMPYRSG